MPKKKIIEIAAFIQKFLHRRRVRVEKIILFGSYARGDFSEDSDVDIAIVSKDFEDKDIFEKAQMLKGLNWSLVKTFVLPFDIVPLASSEWEHSSSLIAQFARQGRQILAG